MERVVVEIAVDRDPVPGVFHTEESIMRSIQDILYSSIPHYHPKVQDAYTKADS